MVKAKGVSKNRVPSKARNNLEKSVLFYLKKYRVTLILSTDSQGCKASKRSHGFFKSVVAWSELKFWTEIL